MDFGGLRKRQFFSLPELNDAISELLIMLNQRPFRKLPVSRAELYATIDRPALQPLPARRFIFAEWKKPESISTITWSWTAITKASRTSWWASKWRCVTRPAWLKSAIRENGWPAMSAA